MQLLNPHAGARWVEEEILDEWTAQQLVGSGWWRKTRDFAEQQRVLRYPRLEGDFDEVSAAEAKVAPPQVIWGV